MKKNQSKVNQLSLNLTRICRVHFAFAGLLGLQIVIYDAWKLVAPEMVLKRWAAVGILALVVTVIWYVARTHTAARLNTYKSLTAALIITDVAVASFSVYTQRGMASRGVMLFTIPILVSAVLMSRAAIYATAALSAVAYILTAVAYFVLNFNEGYKIELYGEVGFYAVTFFIIAALVWNIVKIKRTPES